MVAVHFETGDQFYTKVSPIRKFPWFPTRFGVHDIQSYPCVFFALSFALCHRLKCRPIGWLSTDASAKIRARPGIVLQEHCRSTTTVDLPSRRLSRIQVATGIARNTLHESRRALRWQSRTDGKDGETDPKP